jgi:hypothetical protein
MTSSNAASSDMTSGDAAWSRERVALLTALWAEGLSASLIANRLGGVSRNAVLGKIHRLRRLSGGAVFRTGHPRPAKKKRPRFGPAAKRPLRPVEGAPALRPAAARPASAGKGFAAGGRSSTASPTAPVTPRLHTNRPSVARNPSNIAYNASVHIIQFKCYQQIIIKGADRLSGIK